MSKLIQPQPGLIALRCGHAGEAALVALLGIGVIESGGTPFEDERIAEYYGSLADDPDPVAMATEYWERQVEEHPHMAGHLDPVLKILENMPDDRVVKMRAAAAWLATISISGAESAAKADLLGRVLTEQVALANRRRAPGHAYTLAEAMADLLLRALTGEMAPPHVMADKQAQFIDAWADSGMRAVALATLIRNDEADPARIKWRLWEADPMRRAILAINTVAWELGDDIVIKNGTEVKKAMLAAAQNGTGPRWWNDDIPEDIRSMVRDG